MATREATYVDDIRVAGRGLEGTRMACKQLKSQMNSLANQANDGKYWPPSLMSGAWKGEIIPTDTPFPMKSTTGKKWVKFRVGLRWLEERIISDAKVETAALRQIAGLEINVK